ncbi:MAG TPA: NAD-dependent epimerase/dehydratase family protein [Gemmatimonadaceae bacterium]|nr:NAD-dependent epimerase/dehydratase family protein [Gemmatimonadaceae bacterium]
MTPQAAAAAGTTVPAPPRDDEELEERLSRPTPEVVEALARLPGDVLVLGAAGKMGPSLARMVRRARDAAGSSDRVIAVARFSAPERESALRAHGIETIRCDLADRRAVAALPDAPILLFMAGQKFGTAAAPHAAWVANTVVPAVAAERWAGARFAVFSTGNVYPLSRVGGAGPAEDAPVGPVGEYAMSCLGRERVFEHFAARDGTRAAIIRLNYAVDLRYGVLVDVARKVWRGEPVDVTMAWANVIWQGDANAWTLRALALAAAPPAVLNVSGPALRIRDAAERLATLLGREARIVGAEAPDALLTDARRAAALFGPPAVPTETLLAWVAAWVRGGRSSGAPTKFEVRDGRF